MSTQTVSQRFQKAWQELQRQPVLIIGITFGWGLLIYLQDFISIIGPVVSSLLSVLLIARLFKNGKLPLRPLLALGAISFPLNALWTVLAALYHNTLWNEDAVGMNSATLLVFVMCLCMIVVFMAAHSIAVKNSNLDQGIKIAGKHVLADYKFILWIGLYLSMTAILTVMTHGLLFILFAPYGLALLKASADSYSEEAGVRTGV